MVRSVILVLVLAGLLVLGYLGYRSWSQNRAMMSGAVSNGVSEPGDDAVPERPQRQPSLHQRSSASDPTSEPTKESATEPTSEPAQTSGSLLGSLRQALPAANPTAVPAANPPSDTIPADPPNGLAYAGAGRFEVYRQGNLTWRLNTDSGRACVLFATNEEWRKPQVYRHGCGGSAVP
jgi:hypothetical protein